MSKYQTINAILFGDKKYLSFYEYLCYCNDYINNSKTIENKHKELLYIQLSNNLLEYYKTNNEYIINLTKVIQSFKLSYANNEQLIEDLNLQSKVDYIESDNRIFINNLTLKKILFISLKIDNLIKIYIFNFYNFIDNCIIEYSNYLSLYNGSDFFLLQSQIKNLEKTLNNKIKTFNSEVEQKIKKLDNIVNIIQDPNSEFIQYINHINNYNKNYINNNNKELSKSINKMLQKMDNNYNKYNDLINQIPKDKIVISETFEKKFTENLNQFSLILNQTINNKILELKDEFSNIAYNEFKNYINLCNNGDIAIL